MWPAEGFPAHASPSGHSSIPRAFAYAHDCVSAPDLGQLRGENLSRGAVKAMASPLLGVIVGHCQTNFSGRLW